MPSEHWPNAGNPNAINHISKQEIRLGADVWALSWFCGGGAKPTRPSPAAMRFRSGGKIGCGKPIIMPGLCFACSGTPDQGIIPAPRFDRQPRRRERLAHPDAVSATLSAQ